MQEQEEGRFIPPGPGRIAALAHRGGFGRSRLLCAGFGILGAAFVLHIFGPDLQAAFRRLLGDVPAHALRQSAPGEALRSALLAFVTLVWPIVAAAGVGAILGAVIPALIARRGRGATAVPLPKMPFAPLTAFAVRVLGGTVFVTTTLLLVRGRRWPSADGANPVAWIEAATGLGLDLMVLLGVIAVLAGTAETLALRHAVFRALFLNRAEYRRERRAAVGADEVWAHGRRHLRKDRAP